MAWIRTVEQSHVEREGVAPAVVNGLRVALYCVDGQFYATSDMCTHALAWLSEGYLEDHLIECPLHQGLFDIRTGAAAGAPCTEAIRTFPVRVEDGYLFGEYDG